MTDRAISDLPAKTGWLWFKEGFALFRRQPGALTALLFLNFLASSLLSSIHFVGPFLALLLMPCFSMSLMQGCALADQQRRVTLPVLATGFRQPLFRRLLGVGGVYLAVAGVLVLLAIGIVDEAALRTLIEAMNNPAASKEIDMSPMLPLLLISVLNLMIMVALAFAAPLTAWQHMGVGKSVFYSVVATLRAVRVFFVLLFGWMATMFVTSTLAAMVFGLFGANVARVVVMWLVCVFLLLLQCALYAGYRQMFGAPNLDA